jgi:hypothetical protein
LESNNDRNAKKEVVMAKSDQLKLYPEGQVVIIDHHGKRKRVQITALPGPDRDEYYSFELKGREKPRPRRTNDEIVKFLPADICSIEEGSKLSQADAIRASREDRPSILVVGGMIFPGPVGAKGSRRGKGSFPTGDGSCFVR